MKPNVIVDGIEYNYHVTRDGRVFSLNYHRTGEARELNYVYCNNGYNIVNLYHNGTMKRVQVSRLVALSYIPNPDNKPTVDHINRNRTDDRVENLRWASISEQNFNRGKYKIHNYPKNRKGSKPVRCIETGGIYPSVNEVERQLGFANQGISACCTGKRKSAYGYHWEYVKESD